MQHLSHSASGEWCHSDTQDRNVQKEPYDMIYDITTLVHISYSFNPTYTSFHNHDLDHPCSGADLSGTPAIFVQIL